MSLWYKVSKNLSNQYITPIQYYIAPHIIILKFLYCYDELVLKVNEQTHDCIYYFNQVYYEGNLLDITFLKNITHLLDLYFTF